MFSHLHSYILPYPWFYELSGIHRHERKSTCLDLLTCPCVRSGGTGHAYAERLDATGADAGAAAANDAADAANDGPDGTDDGEHGADEPIDEPIPDESVHEPERHGSDAVEEPEGR